jgi:valyl-tRNA synthetase
LIVGSFELYLDLEVHRDFKQELASCDRDLKALDTKVKLLTEKLSNQDFVAKLPNQVAEVQVSFASPIHLIASDLVIHDRKLSIKNSLTVSS